MHLHSARIAPETSPDSNSGSEVPCGWADAGTQENILSEFSPQLGGFFQSPSVEWAKDRGLGTSSWRPVSPLPFCQHHQGREDRSACSGGCNLGGLSPSTLAVGSPASLAVDSSAGAEQLVPASRVSAWECVRAPPAASGPSSQNSPGRRSLHVLLPAENSPSLVPIAPLAGGSATSNRFSKKAGSRALSSPTQKEELGSKKLLHFALEIRGQGFPFSQAASTPGWGAPCEYRQHLENGADVDEVGELLLSPRIPDLVSRPRPCPCVLLERSSLAARGLWQLLFFIALLSVNSQPTSPGPAAHVLLSGVFLASWIFLPLLLMLKIPSEAAWKFSQKCFSVLSLLHRWERFRGVFL